MAGDDVNDVGKRLDSVRSSLAALRRDLPAVEYRTGQILTVVSELAELVAELATAGGGSASTPAAKAAGKPAEDRKQTLDRLCWMACRALPAGLDGERRDAEICRALEAWGLSREELAALGYKRAEVLVTPAARRSKVACVR